MIVALGIDLVDSKRMARELARGDWSPHDGVFTPSEIAYCTAGKHPERRYATCFAAKEATLKALGMDIPDLGIFREVEIRLQAESKDVVLRRRAAAAARQLGACRILLSVAPGINRAAAMVIVESEHRRTQ